MSFFDNTQPLWLPKGSVRAILVLLMTVAIIFPVFKFVVFHEEIPQTVVQILSLLFGGLIGIVKDYFNSRSTEGNDVKPPTQDVAKMGF